MTLSASDVSDELIRRLQAVGFKFRGDGPDNQAILDAMAQVEFVRKAPARQEETSSDGKQTYYVSLESPDIYAGKVYVTVHCKPDPANPDKPAHLAAKEEDIEWERVDRFEIKTSADFKNFDDSIYWRLAEALECEEYEEDEEDEDDE